MPDWDGMITRHPVLPGTVPSRDEPLTASLMGAVERPKEEPTMPLNLLKRPGHGDQPLPGDDLVGYFEPGVELEGKLKVSNGTVRINTHFSGEIVAEGTVIVAEQGEIEAGITAKIVSVAGKVKGNIHAGERLEIKEHAVVLGDIFTRVLIVGAGGFFEGQCHMPVPEAEKQTLDAAVDRSGATSL